MNAIAERWIGGGGAALIPGSGTSWRQCAPARSAPEVELARVAEQDPLALGRGHAREVLGDRRRVVREVAGRVREVARPQDLLDPDGVAVPDAEAVLHDRVVDVGREVLAGPAVELPLRGGVLARVAVVELLHQVRYPADVDLRVDDAQ